MKRLLVLDAVRSRGGGGGTRLEGRMAGRHGTEAVSAGRRMTTSSDAAATPWRAHGTGTRLRSEMPVSAPQTISRPAKATCSESLPALAKPSTSGEWSAVVASPRLVLAMARVVGLSDAVGVPELPAHDERDHDFARDRNGHGDDERPDGASGRRHPDGNHDGEHACERGEEQMVGRHEDLQAFVVTTVTIPRWPARDHGVRAPG